MHFSGLIRHQIGLGIMASGISLYWVEHSHISGQFITIYPGISLRLRAVLVVMLVGLLSPILSAQFSIYSTQHRPDGRNWQELSTDHFRIIFPYGQDSLAIRAGVILEGSYPQTERLTGGSLQKFPFILSDYNDLTNGFVTSVNFRSEVDLTPFRSKSINPGSGSWLEAVLPHELLHANHANVIKPFSISGLLSVFSLDFGRTINLFPPLGVHEGLAVYQESQHGLHSFSGRAHYQYFNNQFAANLQSDTPWNMAQTLIISDYTIPNNRHYLGGSKFTHWLHNTYGDEVSKRAIAVHQRMFFLGYGYALKQVTGKWPGQLYKDYEQDIQAEEEERDRQIGKTTDHYRQIISTPYSGVQQRRPVWVSDSVLVFYARQYNEAPGFYSYELGSQHTHKLAESVASTDYYFDFDSETTSLLFAENYTLNCYFGAYQTDLVALNVSNGEKTRQTYGKRLYAPQRTGNGIVALQPEADEANIVLLTGADSVKIMHQFDGSTPIAVKANPVQPNQWAVIVNKRGVQALWITDAYTLKEELDGLPEIAFRGGSIHDVVWHKDGKKLLFTVDQFPAMNVFEYSLEDHSIRQLTNALFNAFEARYSPDGKSIAYVTQVDEEQKIAILKKEDFYDRPVPSEVMYGEAELRTMLNTPILGSTIVSNVQEWTVSSYKSDWRWLKPRALFPVIKEKSKVTEIGAVVSSVDALQSQSYTAEVTALQDRMWFNASYTNRSFYPGVRINAYHEPQFTRINLGENGIPEFLQEERGIKLSVPFEYYFDDITRFSSFRFTPSLSIERLRFNNLQPEPVTNFSRQYVAGLFTQLSVRIQQLRRDVQPSSGIVLYGQMEHILNDSDILLTLGNDQFGLGLDKRYGYLLGANSYWKPFQKTNQSLLVGAQLLTQSDRIIFNNDTILPLGFNDSVFDASNQLAKVSARYAIPFVYPDNGGMLVPLYVSSVYATLFSHSLVDFSADDPFSNTRSILGAGLHLQFKISNLAVDIGAGLAFDPTTQNVEFILGSF